MCIETAPDLSLYETFFLWLNRKNLLNRKKDPRNGPQLIPGRDPGFLFPWLNRKKLPLNRKKDPRTGPQLIPGRGPGFLLPG